MLRPDIKNIAVVVAHPDDETLWAGGLILSYPDLNWFIVSLCRGKDEDRAPRFYAAIEIYKSRGTMGDLDDGPEQKPTDKTEIRRLILSLLPADNFDLIITHSPAGEYTRHLRHEETGRAMIELWKTGRITAQEFWTFAYNDDDKKHIPQPIKNANIYQRLPDKIWQLKYELITKTYGFGRDSFEAVTTPKAESFWTFSNSEGIGKWLTQLGQEPI